VWLLVSATDIPDRTQSLLRLAESCTITILKYGQLLLSAGADFLVVTCNTAHAFYEQVQPQLEIPWIHLMDATSSFILKNYPDVKKVGILATDGTIHSGLYSKSLERTGLTPMSPLVGSELQQLVMRAVYDSEWGIKATGVQVTKEAISILERASCWLFEQGAEIAIAGCTELSVGFASMGGVAVPWVAPLDVLASITLDLAKGHRQLENVENQQNCTQPRAPGLLCLPSSVGTSNLSTERELLVQAPTLTLSERGFSYRRGLNPIREDCIRAELHKSPLPFQGFQIYSHPFVTTCQFFESTQVQVEATFSAKIVTFVC
jgi:aspartate racemase